MPLSARRAASGTERMALNFLMTTYIAASVRALPCDQNGTRTPSKEIGRHRVRL